MVLFFVTKYQAPFTKVKYIQKKFFFFSMKNVILCRKGFFSPNDLNMATFPFNIFAQSKSETPRELIFV